MSIELMSKIQMPPMQVKVSKKTACWQSK